MGGLLAMRQGFGVLLSAFVLLAWPSVSRADDFSGKVIGLADGDAITVLQERTPVKFRLHGIDAPETGQDFGSRAKQATSELAFGKVVTVQPVDTDRYSRTVALVTLPDGRSLNHELVCSGMAWWFRKFAPGDVALERLEAEARQAGRGVWSQPRPVPPWDWRDNTRLPTELTTKVGGEQK
jgi:micrococcal nuclease